jgi:hypothetical protein
VATTLILQNSAQESLEKIAACWQQRGDDAWKKKRTIRHWRQAWQHPTAEASEQAFSAAVDSLVEPLAETRAALLFLQANSWTKRECEKMMLMLMMMHGLLPWPPIHYPSSILLHRTRKPQGYMPPWQKQKNKNPSNKIASFKLTTPNNKPNFCKKNNNPRNKHTDRQRLFCVRNKSLKQNHQFCNNRIATEFYAKEEQEEEEGKKADWIIQVPRSSQKWWRGGKEHSEQKS